MRPSKLALVMMAVICASTSVWMMRTSVPASAHHYPWHCQPDPCPSPSPSPTPSDCDGIVVKPGEDDLQDAIDSHPTDTTFCLQPGTFRLTAAIIPKSGDSLIGAPGTVLNGSKLVTSFTQSGSSWYAGGQTQQAPTSTHDCVPETYIGCRYPEGVYFDDVALWQVTSLSALSPGEFYFDYAADRIYVADNPSGHKVEASIASQAIWGASGYQDRVTVQGLLIEKFANILDGAHNHAVKPGNAWLIEDNEIRLNHGVGVFGSTNSVIRGNYIHHNGQYGVFSSDSSGTLFEDNEIASNNIEGFDPWAAGGSKFIKTTNLTLRGNYVHHNTGPGLKGDTDNIDTMYEDNVAEYNTREGISHEISYHATIRNNTVRYNDTDEAGLSVWFGANIHLNNSQNVEIYGNTVVATGDTNGIGMVDSERGIGEYGKYEIRNVFVHDNTVTMTAGAETGLVGNRNPNVYGSMGNSFKSNTYYLPDLTDQYWRWDGFLTKDGWQGEGQDLTGNFLRL